MTTLIVFAIYFAGMPVSYIVSMKRAVYVIRKYDGYDPTGFAFDQRLGTAIFTPLSWAGVPLLGLVIIFNKAGKLIDKKFNLDE